MNKSLLILVLVVALVAGGYLYLSNMSPAQSPERAGENVGTLEKKVIVNLSEQNNSGETGVAELLETDGKLYVSLNLEGAPEGVSQPAHIHLGSCPKPGAVKYALSNVLDGASETEVQATLQELKSESPLAVNVHKSGAQSGVYVACGDVEF